jgi:Flp pilus assembly protein TadD
MRIHGSRIHARRGRYGRLPALLATLALITAGCAGRPPATDAIESISTTQLLAGEIFAVEADDTDIVDAAEILSVDVYMRAFIDEFVDATDTRYLRLQQLLRAIITDGSFGLVYNDNTRTAAGTFSERSGNCLSFTNMFIAMAREAGLDVSYQEVDVPPDWSMSGDTYVMSRHVNVKVQLRSDVEHVVDFNIDDFKSSYERTEISDERAFAHFFSNKGVESMQERDHDTAFRYFRTALEFDREFAPAWINLAALYNREGQPDFAEAAYHEALRLQPDELLAMSNLARLYDAAGNAELAASYRDRVRYHRDRNPYYRYRLARQAFLDRDYETSIDHLEFAVSKKRWEDSFYFLMGLSYLQLGDEDEARKWLERAEEVAEGDALKRNYQSKLDLLLD